MDSLSHCRRPFISERLQEKKKEKFGNVQDDFSGPSDSYDAPLDLQGNIGGKDFYVFSPMDNPAVTPPPQFHSEKPGLYVIALSHFVLSADQW